MLRAVMVFIKKRHNFIFMHGYCLFIYTYNNYIHEICGYCMCFLHFNNVPNIPDKLVFGPSGITLLLGSLTMCTDSGGSVLCLCYGLCYG